jgi:hypothetical protein
MSDAVEILRSLPLEVFEAPQPNDAWMRCPLASVSDGTLIRSVAAAISRPKIQIDSSFLLHAPLELLARAWHLQHLPPNKRETARRRIAEIAVRYAGNGPEIDSRRKEYPDISRALLEARAALRTGDADTVDAALLFLLPRISVEHLRSSLADEVLPSLACAAHVPILLMMLAVATGRFPGASALLRSPLRALALHADLRLTWMETVRASATGDAPELFDCLAAPPVHVQSPGESIAPPMLAVERDGYAMRLLAPRTSAVAVRDAERILLRVAALSMLQDDPEHAPYGWTHCFTLPHSILSLTDVVPDTVRAVRIAATHALGFRATLGHTRLVYPYAPELRRDSSLLGLEPADAAAVAYHSAGDGRRSLRTQLVECAASHADAHLVKYTMACLTACDRDPGESSLYLAAAAYLRAWWDKREFGNCVPRVPLPETLLDQGVAPPGLSPI